MRYEGGFSIYSNSFRLPAAFLWSGFSSRALRVRPWISRRPDFPFKVYDHLCYLQQQFGIDFKAEFGLVLHCDSNGAPDKETGNGNSSTRDWFDYSPAEMIQILEGIWKDQRNLSVNPLKGGHTNRMYKVSVETPEGKEQHYALRISAPVVALDVDQWMLKKPHRIAGGFDSKTPKRCCRASAASGLEEQCDHETWKVFESQPSLGETCMVEARGGENIENMRNEVMVQELASAAGIGPEVVFFDKIVVPCDESQLIVKNKIEKCESLVMVSRFVEGEDLAKRDIEGLTRAEKKSVVDSVRVLHNLKDREDLLKSRNIFVAIEQESKQAKQDGADLPANYDEMLAHLADIRNAMGPFKEKVLCHRDLHGGNIILRANGNRSSEAMLIDYEFSGKCDLFYELASIARNLKYQDDELLTDYFGPDRVEAIDLARLRLMRAVKFMDSASWAFAMSVSPKKPDHTYDYLSHAYDGLNGSGGFDAFVSFVQSPDYIESMKLLAEEKDRAEYHRRRLVPRSSESIWRRILSALFNGR